MGSFKNKYIQNTSMALVCLVFVWVLPQIDTESEHYAHNCDIIGILDYRAEAEKRYLCSTSSPQAHFPFNAQHNLNNDALFSRFRSGFFPALWILSSNITAGRWQGGGKVLRFRIGPASYHYKYWFLFAHNLWTDDPSCVDRLAHTKASASPLIAWQSAPANGYIMAIYIYIYSPLWRLMRLESMCVCVCGSGYHYWCDYILKLRGHRIHLTAYMQSI